MTNSCVYLITHEAAGALATRLSLRPLLIEARTVLAKLGRNPVARMRTCVSTSLRAKRSNPFFLCAARWMLRFARNDGLRIGCLKIESEKCDRRSCATLPIVIARLDRAIQYSRAVSDRTEEPRRTGYPAFAGYDGCWWRRASGFCRHCEEPTGRANARPMTGSATKQSILSLRGAMDCFASLAMTGLRHSGAARRAEPGISRFLGTIPE